MKEGRLRPLHNVSPWPAALALSLVYIGQSPASFNLIKISVSLITLSSSCFQRQLQLIHPFINDQICSSRDSLYCIVRRTIAWRIEPKGLDAAKHLISSWKFVGNCVSGPPQVLHYSDGRNRICNSVIICYPEQPCGTYRHRRDMPIRFPRASHNPMN